MKILVVDDEAPIREMLQRGLTQVGGFSVEIAQNGQEAIEKIEKDIFDLVLTDLKMPGMDWAETFRQIRRINDSVPVVIITGYPTSELMEKALKQAPFGVMKKPFDARDIRRSAANFLEGAKAKGKPVR
jgi:DNA-binding NtrC family response regulator